MVGAGGEKANPRQGSRISAPTKNEVESRRAEEAIFGGPPSRNRLPGAQQQKVSDWGVIVLVKAKRSLMIKMSISSRQLARVVVEGAQQ